MSPAQPLFTMPSDQFSQINNHPSNHSTDSIHYSLQNSQNSFSPPNSTSIINQQSITPAITPAQTFQDSKSFISKLGVKSLYNQPQIQVDQQSQDSFSLSNDTISRQEFQLLKHRVSETEFEIIHLKKDLSNALKLISKLNEIEVDFNRNVGVALMDSRVDSQHSRLLFSDSDSQHSRLLFPDSDSNVSIVDASIKDTCIINHWVESVDQAGLDQIIVLATPDIQESKENDEPNLDLEHAASTIEFLKSLTRESSLIKDSNSEVQIKVVSSDLKDVPVNRCDTLLSVVTSLDFEDDETSDIASVGFVLKDVIY